MTAALWGLFAFATVGPLALWADGRALRQSSRDTPPNPAPDIGLPFERTAVAERQAYLQFLMDQGAVPHGRLWVLAGRKEKS